MCVRPNTIDYAVRIDHASRTINHHLEVRMLSDLLATQGIGKQIRMAS